MDMFFQLLRRALLNARRIPLARRKSQIGIYILRHARVGDMRGSVPICCGSKSHFFNFCRAPGAFFFSQN